MIFSIAPSGAVFCATKTAFPATGAASTTYVDKSTGKTYKWENSAYVEYTPIAKGTPSYHGTFLGVSYLEFTEICSPTLIDFTLGDTIYYPRTGLYYKLYSVPVASRRARTNTSGESFVYSNVQFHAATKELELTPFRDIVANDNNAVYSTTPTISTYENVAGIAARIQANMDIDHAGEWTIEVVDASEYATLDALLSEAREFTVSDVSCFDALKQIYDVWEGIGFVHSYNATTGKNVITIGRPNIQDSDNSTSVFSYGKGNGLKVLTRAASTLNELITRLYAYGSSDNMISRYYNNLDTEIYDSDAVNIPNLMLPLTDWGTTSSKPDPRKAYLQASSAITSKYGIRSKTLYFDGSDQEEIKPSLKEVTAADVRGAMQSTDEYYPNASKWPNTSRMDKVVSAENPLDNGTVSTDGSKYTEQKQTAAITAHSGTIAIGAGVDWYKKPTADFDYNFASATGFNSTGTLYINGELVMQIDSSAVCEIEKMCLCVEVAGHIAGKVEMNMDVDSGNSYQFSIFDAKLDIGYAGAIKLYFEAQFAEYNQSTSARSITYDIDGTSLNLCLRRPITSRFTVNIPQIGFDIATRKSTNSGKGTFALNSGLCAGRSFTIVSTKYLSSSDSWQLTCQRVLDEDLGMYFPNCNMVIATNDQFVLTDIEMPAMYIGFAESKLHTKALAYLNAHSKPKIVYTPEIDSKKIQESLDSGAQERIIEGMYMTVQDTDLIDTTDHKDYILIDSLTINENESNIPTFSVTLRDEKYESTYQKMVKSYAEQRAEERAAILEQAMADTGEYVLFSASAKVDKTAQSFSYPSGSSSCTPSVITVKADVEGYVPSSYQWQKMNASGTWENISGATNSYYDVSPSDAGFQGLSLKVRCVVTCTNSQTLTSDETEIVKITDDVSSAEKLATARTIWGQPFDGSANVGGAMTGVTSITMAGNHLIDIDSNGNFRFNGNLYATGSVSSGGIGSSGSGSGGISNIKLNGSETYRTITEGVADLNLLSFLSANNYVTTSLTGLLTNLTTTTKTSLVAAINEVDSLAKGASSALVYTNYAALVTAMNAATSEDDFKKGQSAYIETLNVPDVWIKDTASTKVTYTYVDDATFITDILTNGGQVGYFKFAPLETQKVDLTGYAKTDGSNASGTWAIGISGTAAKATADASGNNIASTYATNSDLAVVTANIASLSARMTSAETWMESPEADEMTADVVNVTDKINLGGVDLTTAKMTAWDAKQDALSNAALLATYTQTEANLADAVSKKHSHSNLSLLESYTQTEANLASAVSMKHSHSNKAELDLIVTGDKAKWDNHIDDDDNPHSVTKAQVGLGNVENTALSTWTGTARITTLGTITTGVWNGTAIANDYLAHSAMTIAGTSVSLGGSITADTIVGAATASATFAGTAAKAGQLATTRTIWGQDFNGTANVSGALTGATNITASGTILGNKIAVGNAEHLIEWDSNANAFKFIGNIYATGSVSAGGVGTGGSGGGGTVSSIKLDTSGPSATISEGVANLNLSSYLKVKVGSTQYNMSAGVVTLPAYPTTLSSLSDDATHRLVTDSEKSTWNGKADASALTSHTGDTTIHITSSERTSWNGKADASTLTSHTSNTSNPHSVTASQVGLGNVNNTSDADKPVSTATRAAIDLAETILAAGIASAESRITSIEEWMAEPVANDMLVDVLSITDRINLAGTDLTLAKMTAWDAKQDAISDISTIRTQASNGNTAYGWGNHSIQGYAKTADLGSFAYISSLAFSSLSNKPTTISGYGITDAYTKTETDNKDITAISLTASVLTLTRTNGNLTADIPTWNQSTTGNAATATNATNDASGNNIVSTYATKTSLNSTEAVLSTGIATLEGRLTSIESWMNGPSLSELLVGTLNITKGVNMGGVDIKMNTSGQVEVSGAFKASATAVTTLTASGQVSASALTASGQAYASTFSVNGHVIEWDSAASAFKFNGNLYATGSVSAGGVASGGSTAGVASLLKVTSNTHTMAANDTYEMYIATGIYISITLPSSPVTGRHFKVWDETEGFEVVNNTKTFYIHLGTGRGCVTASSSTISLSSEYCDDYNNVWEFLYDGTAWHVTPLSDIY